MVRETKNGMALPLVALSCLGALVGAGRSGRPAPKDTLAEAKLLADEEYKGWTYGSDPAKKQVDCVQFVYRLVTRLHGAAPDAATKTRILISDVTPAEVKQGTVIADRDPRTQGVAKALVDAGMGTTVALADVKPGDFIQYWKKDANGAWHGHSAVVEQVIPDGQRKRVKLFGAHQSINKVGSDAPPHLILADQDDRRIYLARFK